MFTSGIFTCSSRSQITCVFQRILKFNVTYSLINQFSLYGRRAIMSGDLTDLRMPYKEKHEIFDFDHLASKDPFMQFKSWFDEALNTETIKEPNAVALTTATKDGFPSARIILLKEYSPEFGFKFFTNYESRKAKELKENPHCGLLFYWPELMRQIRIEGTASKIPEEESIDYFRKRPKPNQIGAVVSRQSQVIISRQVLDESYNALTSKYSEEDATVPKPDNWGGYSIQPHMFEFWQGQSDRLHDRIVFRKPSENEIINPETTHRGENGWLFERLCP